MHKPLVVLGIIIAVAVGGAFLLSRMSSSRVQAATISGTFNINGNIPEGATITTYGKKYSSSDAFQELHSGTKAEDGAAWESGDLESGATYEGYAEIVSNGKVIAKSDTLTVSAPASNVPVVINIDSENGEANATIAGNVVVNGYIPEGSTISTEGRVVGTSQFTVVSSGVPARRSTAVAYTTAISGESYEVKGYLYDASGNQIGTSSLLVVTAPAKNEVLTINSSAQAPAPTAAAGSPTPAASNQVISGTVTFNGVAPANSRIVILQKEYNATDYQVAVDNVSPQTGARWSWNGAKASTWYDIEAVLKQKQDNGTDKDLATSQVASVAAPASGVSLTINSGISIPAPTGQITMVCGTNNGNQWNGTLTIPAVSGARTYWYQAGTSQGGNNLANTTVAANGSNDVQVNINNLTTQQTAFFRYAYSFVANVGVGNSQFSPFSASSQGACGF